MRKTTIWATRRIYTQLWLRAILFAAPLSTLFFLPGEFAAPGGSPWFLLAVFAFMVICMWPFAFAAHWVEGRDEGLRIRYWPVLSRTILYANIASVDYRPSISPWEFAGIGLRLAPGGILAFANRKGPGLGLTTKDGRSYYVVLNDDQELAEIRDRITHARHDLRADDGQLR